MEERLKWLENPEVFRVNRLDAHSDHDYYESEQAWRQGKKNLIQSLNGTWKFHWSKNPGERPAQFYEPDYDLSGFGEIQVPGHMELQGHDRIHYINTMYPWEGHTFLRPPHIDWEYNPVGSYVLDFDLKKELWDRRVCISFQGVEQAFFLWLNGEFIGYSEDTFTPSDFDLTGALRRENNRLCVEVYKRSSAAWIEDQDFFRFSGIFREVFLYGKPEVHVEDLWAKASLLEDNKTGTLSLELKVSKKDGEGSRPLDEPYRQVDCELVLRDRQGQTVYSRTPEFVCKNGVWKSSPVKLSGITPWCHETPALYECCLYLRDKEGQLLELVSCPIGFRRFELRGKVMCLNGKRLIINGVNRHEWNLERGRAITREDMLADIEVLKKNNISAVRTCHYPNQSLWYRLCDEAGIYVMDETNLESHGSWQKMGKCEPSWNVPGNKKEWEACVVDRAVSMLERDKNHACILWWSCGNESYAGTGILAMSRFFHERDTSRLVHYEGVFWNREYDEISDVESRMYATPGEIREYLENDPRKPFLLCEYMHDMGNSLGGMESYVRLLEEFPMYQGGFIWDYMDQAIYYTDADGKRVPGYGGDFGDRPSDYNFSGNGIVFADRSEKPAMQEVRFWYSTPGEREKLLREKEDWYRKQIQAIKTQAQPEKNGGFTVVEGDVMLGVHGKDFEVIFSYQDAGPVSLVYEGQEWIYRPMKPALWRASTENDKGCGFPVRSAQWMGADMFLLPNGCEKEITQEYVRITYHYLTRTVPETAVYVSYQVDGEGNILVNADYEGKEGLPELPVFGLRFPAEVTADKVQWLGLSGETYPDRKKGGRCGFHESGTEIPDYLVPQENGCRSDTLYASLWKKQKGGAEKGIHFYMTEQPFYFSAIPYTPQELECAFHKEELPVSRRTVVSLLGAMRGVGGIDSWGSDVERPYRISGEENHHISFMIKKTGPENI